MPVRTRVGHSFIKAEMARDGCGLRRRALGALLLPRLLVRRHRHARGDARARRARRAGPAPLAELVAEFYRYVASGEINSTVDDQARAARRDPRAFADRASSVDELDGLTVELPTAPGSTCARPTPNRCCGSTSRARPTKRCPRCATKRSPSSAADGELRGLRCRSTRTCSRCWPARATITRRCASRCRSAPSRWSAPCACPGSRSRTASRCCCWTRRHPVRTASADPPTRLTSMAFDEQLLEDAARLERRDEHRLLWGLATAGAQVRRAVDTVGDFGIEQLRGPRCRGRCWSPPTPRRPRHPG